MKEQIKKVALAAAVACAAIGGVRAGETYNYQWLVSDVAPSSGTSVGEKAYTAYLFVNSTSDSSAYKSGVTMSDILGVLSKQSEAVQNSDTTALTKYTISWGKNTGYGSTASWDMTARKSFQVSNLSVFALILDSTSFLDAENYMFVKAAKGGTDHDGASCLTLSTGGKIDFGSQANNSWYSIASLNVPEPTSGVLLLVGVAALALRRKKAA